MWRLCGRRMNAFEVSGNIFVQDHLFTDLFIYQDVVAGDHRGDEMLKCWWIPRNEWWAGHKNKIPRSLSLHQSTARQNNNWAWKIKLCFIPGIGQTVGAGGERFDPGVNWLCTYSWWRLLEPWRFLLSAQPPFFAVPVLIVPTCATCSKLLLIPCALPRSAEDFLFGQLELVISRKQGGRHQSRHLRKHQLSYERLGSTRMEILK